MSPFLTIIERCLLILIELANVRYHDCVQHLTGCYMQLDGRGESNRCFLQFWGLDAPKNGQSK